MRAAVQDLPTGTVTYFFSDVQDSTGLLQRLGPGYKDVIERHAEIIRQEISAQEGIEVSTEGDSFFAVFTGAPQAVAASASIQQALAAEPWPAGGNVAVRIGLHTGTTQLGADNYVGIDVNRAARISAAGHGGQIVLSDAVRILTPDDVTTDLGEHVLRGLERSEHLFQLDVAGLPQAFPPLRTVTSADPTPPSAAALLDLLAQHEGAGSQLAVRINLTLAETYVAEEDYEGARAVTLESLRLAEDAGDIFYIGMSMRWLGVVAVEDGDPKLGAQLDGAGAAAVERAGGTYPPTIVPIKGAIDRARATLGAQANEAYDEGRELALLDAVALARKRLATVG